MGGPPSPIEIHIQRKDPCSPIEGSLQLFILLEKSVTCLLPGASSAEQEKGPPPSFVLLLGEWAAPVPLGVCTPGGPHTMGWFSWWLTITLGAAAAACDAALHSSPPGASPVSLVSPNSRSSSSSSSSCSSSSNKYSYIRTLAGSLLPPTVRLSGAQQQRQQQKQQQQQVAAAAFLSGGPHWAPLTVQRGPPPATPSALTRGPPKRIAGGPLLAVSSPVRWRSLLGLGAPKTHGRGPPSSSSSDLFGDLLVGCLRLCRPLILAAREHKKPLLHAAAVSIKSVPSSLLLLLLPHASWFAAATPVMLVVVVVVVVFILEPPLLGVEG